MTITAFALCLYLSGSIMFAVGSLLLLIQEINK